MSDRLGTRQELVTNPPGVTIVTVIATVFGVVGLGAGVLSLVLTLVGGGVLVAVGGSVSGAPAWLGWAQLVAQATGAVISVLLCIGIVAAAIAAFGRRPRPLQLLSGVSIAHIVVFDIVLYTAQQLGSLAVQVPMVQSLPSTGGLHPMVPILGVTAFFLLVVVAFALARITFWAITWITLRQALLGPEALDVEILD